MGKETMGVRSPIGVVCGRVVYGVADECRSASAFWAARKRGCKSRARRNSCAASSRRSGWYRKETVRGGSAGGRDPLPTRWRARLGTGLDAAALPIQRASQVRVRHRPQSQVDGSAMGSGSAASGRRRRHRQWRSGFAVVRRLAAWASAYRRAEPRRGPALTRSAQP